MSAAPEPAITRVGIVGGGIMGSGIAEVCARSGREVIVVEADDARAESASERIKGSLAKATARGRVSESEAG